MSFNLRNRSLLTVQDYTQREFQYLLDLARDLKRAKYAKTEQKHLAGKEIVLIFEKTQHAHPLRLRGRLLRPGGARHLSRIRRARRSDTRSRSRTPPGCSGGCTTRSSIAGSAQAGVEELAKYAGVPVFNGLTDEYHPTQMLADVMTMRENSDRARARDQVRLCRRHALEHGPLADDRRLPHGHGRAHRRPEAALAVGRLCEDRARSREEVRGEAHHHRRCGCRA